MLKKYLLFVFSFTVLFAGSAQASSKYVGSIAATAGSTGVEVSFPSFMMDNVRQQVTLFSYTYGIVIEVNPHYLFKLDKNMELGVGPGISLAMMSGASQFDFHIGASFEYAIEDLRLGLEVHGGQHGNATIVKVGWAF